MLTPLGSSRQLGPLGVGVRRGVAFSPYSLSGFVLGLDASALTGFANNDPVATFADRSGNWPATQATAGKQPTYLTNQQNGLPLVRFDGTGDWLENTGFNSLAGVAGYGIWVLAKNRNSATNNVTLISPDEVNCFAAIQISASNATYAAVGSGSFYVGFDDIATAAVESHAFIYDGSLMGNTNRMRIWHQGSQETMDYSSGTIPATTGTSSGFYISRRGVSESLFAPIDLAEIYAINRTPTAQEIIDINTFFNDKWAMY